MHSRPQIISRCLFCDATDRHPYRNCCAGCFDRLPKNENACVRCALPLNNELQICGSCLSEPPKYHRCFAPLTYSTPVNNLINRLKHQGDFFSVPLFADLLVEQVYEKASELPDVLVPIPIHWTRYLRRGFNQADVLAKQISTRLQIPVRHLLTKPTRSQRQQSLSRKERSKNMRGKFALRKQPFGISALNNISESKIALIDDVFTTGVTVETAAKALIKGGAKNIDVWCIARTPSPETAHF